MCLLAAAVSYIAAVALVIEWQQLMHGGSEIFLHQFEVELMEPERDRTAWSELRSKVLAFVPMLAVLAVLVWKRVNRTYRTSLSPFSRAQTFRWSLFIGGLGLSSGLWVLALFAMDWLIHQQVGVVNIKWVPEPAGGWFVYLPVMLIVIAPFSAIEETIFRKLLPERYLALSAPYIVSVGLSTLLFVLVHNTAEPVRVIQLSLGAFALAWSVYRLGGIEFAIGAHIAWNLAVLITDLRSIEIANGSAVSWIGDRLPRGMALVGRNGWLDIPADGDFPAL